MKKIILLVILLLVCGCSKKLTCTYEEDYEDISINNLAHIGGLIGGVLVSMAVGVKYKSTKSDIINGIIMTLIFTGFLIYMIFYR